MVLEHRIADLEILVGGFLPVGTILRLLTGKDLKLTILELTYILLLFDVVHEGLLALVRQALYG